MLLLLLIGGVEMVPKTKPKAWRKLVRWTVGGCVVGLRSTLTYDRYRLCGIPCLEACLSLIPVCVCHPSILGADGCLDRLVAAGVLIGGDRSDWTCDGFVLGGV